MLTPAPRQAALSVFRGKLQTLRSPLLLSARLINTQVFLKWETPSNNRTEFFEVERSTDGRLFVSLGRIIGHSHPVHPQAYSFVDSAPRPGLNYYRLRLMDTEQEHLSRVAAVVIGKNMAAAIDAFPNPFLDKLNISVLSPSDQELTLRVSDSRGLVLFTEKLTILQGSNLHQYDLGKLQQGLYMFTFTGPDSLIVKRIQKS